MSNDLNYCSFIGRLGTDPESRFTTSGDCVTSFSIAVGSQWKNKDGEKQDATEWVNIVAWRKLGEICAEYLKKGSQVFISGKIKTEKYQDKEGVTRYSTKIVAEQMQMLGGKREGDQHEEPAARPAQADKPAATAGKGSFDNFDDDIPFFEPCRHGGLWRSM